MAEEEVPKELVVPMDDIAEGVRGLRIAFVNVFGIVHAGGSWTLIDAGIPFSASAIRNWAERHFERPPLAIVLTHGHFDHVSGAGDLANHWNVPVYAHPLEAPYLTGEREYPPPKVGAGGGLMSLLSPMYPRGPVDLGKRLRLFSSDAELNEMPNWQVIHTPGHTPGHVSFFRPADHLLLAGDAFCTTKPESFFDAALAQPPELHGPPAYFTADPAQAAQSIRQLAALRPRIVAPGHGRALAGLQMEDKLARFAAEFEAEKQEERLRAAS